MSYDSNQPNKPKIMQVVAEEVKTGDLIKFETRVYGFVTKITKIEKQKGGYRYCFEGVSIEQERRVTGCGIQRRNKYQTYPAGIGLFLNCSNGRSKISAQQIK